LTDVILVSDKRDDYQTITYLALSECRIGVFSVPRDTQTFRYAATRHNVCRTNS